MVRKRKSSTEPENRYKNTIPKIPSDIEFVLTHLDNIKWDKVEQEYGKEQTDQLRKYNKAFKDAQLSGNMP